MIGYGKHSIVIALDEQLGSRVLDYVQANDASGN